MKGEAGQIKEYLAEADARSPTPEFTEDRICAQCYICETCKTDVCTLPIHDGDKHGCEPCETLYKAMMEVAETKEKSRTSTERIEGGNKQNAVIAEVSRPNSFSDVDFRESDIKRMGSK